MHPASIKTAATWGAALVAAVVLIGEITDAVSNVASLPTWTRWILFTCACLCWISLEYYSKHGLPWRLRHGRNPIGFVIGARHRLAFAGLVVLVGALLIRDLLRDSEKSLVRAEATSIPDVESGAESNLVFSLEISGVSKQAQDDLDNLIADANADKYKSALVKLKAWEEKHGASDATGAWSAMFSALAASERAKTGAFRCPSGAVLVPGGYVVFKVDLSSSQDRIVFLSPYCLDQAEVTVADYAACVRRGKCVSASIRMESRYAEVASDDSSLHALCNGERADRYRHPINCITRDEAAGYCIAQDRNLPTEAQWQLAAEYGHSGARYPWGAEPPGPELVNACDSSCRDLGAQLRQQWDVLFFESDGYAATAPVGSFKKGYSSLGVQDLAGNVAEWVADEDGQYVPGNYVDPMPTTSTRDAADKEYVVRGGDWQSSSEYQLMTDVRAEQPAWVREPGIGFRCAHEAQEKL